MESGTIDKLIREAQNMGRLNAKPCAGTVSSGGDGSGQYEAISLNNIMTGFAILLGGIGRIYT